MAAATAVTSNEGPGVFFTGSFVLDPASVNDGDLEESTVAVDGTKIGDIVRVQPRAAMGVDLIIQQVYVSAAGTITFQLLNQSGGALNMASATWDYEVKRGRNAAAFAG